MSQRSLPARVAAAKALLEEIRTDHDLRAEQLANLQEAIEFLDRLEASFQEEPDD